MRIAVSNATGDAARDLVARFEGLPNFHQVRYLRERTANWPRRSIRGTR